MKKLKDLGTPLSKKEQKAINGGQTNNCHEEYNFCIASCGGIINFGYLGAMLRAGCYAECSLEKFVCNTQAALSDA